MVGGGQAVMRDHRAKVNAGASDPRKDGAAIPEPLLDCDDCNDDPASSRWVQLALGLVCMLVISSPQYVWTLFTTPIDPRCARASRESRSRFSILIVVHTFLSPCQGFLVDGFGPRLLLSRRRRGDGSELDSGRACYEPARVVPDIWAPRRGSGPASSMLGLDRPHGAVVS